MAIFRHKGLLWDWSSMVVGELIWRQGTSDERKLNMSSDWSQVNPASVDESHRIVTVKTALKCYDGTSDAELCLNFLVTKSPITNPSPNAYKLVAVNGHDMVKDTIAFLRKKKLFLSWDHAAVAKVTLVRQQQFGTSISYDISLTSGWNSNTTNSIVPFDKIVLTVSDKGYESTDTSSQGSQG